MVISDYRKGLKAPATAILGATWQGCRVGLLKNPDLRVGVCRITRLQLLRGYFGRCRIIEEKNDREREIDGGDGGR